MSDPPGVLEDAGFPRTIVIIHMGAPARVECRRGGESHRGTAIHGDIDIIPSGTPTRWELKDKDTALVVTLAPELLGMVAEESGLRPGQSNIRNRFQVRDAQIEHIGWALQTEMERGYPCGRLYMDSLATALAAQLLRNHSSLPGKPLPAREGLAGRRLKQVLAFIEDNLNADLSLNDIAAVAGLSLSHCKALFQQSTGLPIHQYLIRRRVERAASLLRDGSLPISQVALEAGFAHQSHLAMHMRRVLGISPKTFQSALQ
jgi:AraC family transcriptional regulator